MTPRTNASVEHRDGESAAADAPVDSSRRVLSAHYSAYLDLIRFSAAAMVVLYHLKFLQVGPESVRKFIPSYGHEFVIVFFVLSGYVIAATVHRKRHHRLIDYAVDRAARIYSVLIPTLLISSLVSLTLWTQHDPGAGTMPEIPLALALNLVFLSQSWALNAFPASNPAFWSLPYEVMYYVLYGCLYFLRGRRRVFWCLLVALIAGPRILLLLPCWLAGVAAYSWRDRLAVNRPVAWLLVASPVLVFGLLSYLRFGSSMRAAMELQFGTYYAQLAWSADFPKDYISAIFLGLHLVAVRQLDLSLPQWLERAAASAATLTFTLYLLHFPTIMLTRWWFGSSSTSAACILSALVFVTVATWLVGSYSEARRGQFRTMLVGYIKPRLAQW